MKRERLIKHWEFIEAYKNGAEIETYVDEFGEWVDADSPDWSMSRYRIKKIVATDQQRIDELEAEAKINEEQIVRLSQATQDLAAEKSKLIHRMGRHCDAIQELDAEKNQWKKRCENRTDDIVRLSDENVALIKANADFDFNYRNVETMRKQNDKMREVLKMVVAVDERFVGNYFVAVDSDAFKAARALLDANEGTNK